MAWTNPEGFVSDELYAELREHFNDEEIMELGVCCAALIGMSKLGLAYDMLEREDYCPIQPPAS